jgi:hypothetical protein
VAERGRPGGSDSGSCSRPGAHHSGSDYGTAAIRVGAIKAATEQAIADAATVGKLKERAENQSATVNLVATQASAAKLLAQQAEEQAKRAGQRLEALDKAIGEANAALAQLRPEADFTQLVVSAQMMTAKHLINLSNWPTIKATRWLQGLHRLGSQP